MEKGSVLFLQRGTSRGTAHKIIESRDRRLKNRVGSFLHLAVLICIKTYLTLFAEYNKPLPRNIY
jgi:hypothetical protein